MSRLAAAVCTFFQIFICCIAAQRLRIPTTSVVPDNAPDLSAITPNPWSDVIFKESLRVGKRLKRICFRRPKTEDRLHQRYAQPNWYRTMKKRIRSAGHEEVFGVSLEEFASMADGHEPTPPVVDGLLHLLAREYEGKRKILAVPEHVYEHSKKNKALPKEFIQDAIVEPELILIPEFTNSQGFYYWYLIAISRKENTLSIYDPANVLTKPEKKKASRFAKRFMKELDYEQGLADRIYQITHPITPKVIEKHSTGINTLVNAARIMAKRCIPLLTPGTSSFYRRHLALKLLKAAGLD